jgi:hypothetical protein
VTRDSYEDNIKVLIKMCRSQWPRGLSRGSAAARMLRLRVRIPPEAWMSVCCEFVRGLCVGLITGESYRVWRVCDREVSIMRRPWPPPWMGGGDVWGN